jgi:hypoxanthine phosphoribosyltransferase
MDDQITRVLISEPEIQRRIVALGEQITADYRETRDLLLVSVLKGSVILLADLMRAIHLPLAIDFMAAASYGASTQTSGVVRIVKDLETDISGRDILLVEDIIDSGLTLRFLRELLLRRAPASLRICALLNKPERREADVPVDYIGFDIPNEFVVGYGLDYNERYRNLPYIAVLRPRD